MEFELITKLPLQTITTIGFLLLIGIYALFSFIMYYHWNEYSIEPRVTKITLILYFVCTLPLFAILGLITRII